MYGHFLSGFLVILALEELGLFWAWWRPLTDRHVANGSLFVLWCRKLILTDFVESSRLYSSQSSIALITSTKFQVSWNWPTLIISRSPLHCTMLQSADSIPHILTKTTFSSFEHGRQVVIQSSTLERFTFRDHYCIFLVVLVMNIRILLWVQSH